MLIKDKVYGEVEITEQVLIELINSKPIQRLKGIAQAGASKYVLANKTNTRYDHCIGVMILLKFLKASMEEQIAGLLHDVAHTAFSHTVDFVFKNKNHDYHEQHHKRIVMDSEIPEILEMNNININIVLDEHNFPLLEKNLPDLCGDRIDYTLRDMATYKNSSVTKYLKHFIVVDKEIIMDSSVIAYEFAKDYLNMNETVWADPLEVATFQILADAIRIALKENILTEADLFQDDDFVYNKLESSGNHDIREKLSLLTPSLKIANDPVIYDFHTKSKFRYIDPKFFENQKIGRVTELFPEFKKRIEESRKVQEKGFYVKIL